MAVRNEDVGGQVYCNRSFRGVGVRGTLIALIGGTAVVQFGNESVDTMQAHEAYAHELDAVSAAQREAQDKLSKALVEVNELTARLGKLIDKRARDSEPSALPL
jgi:hypothetical protein